MALRRLQVTDFRCLHAAVLEFDSRFTLISGSNGSGKTSLLEAIYLLGRGRSFRSRRLEHLIRAGASRFAVIGEVESPLRRIPLGVEGDRSGIRARIGGAPAGSLAELALALPVQIIDPEVHKLIEEGPARRRRFMDWGVFHVEPTFIGHWQRYHQALKQRNAALKARQARTLSAVWDADLIHHGHEISQVRARYIASLQVEAHPLVGRLLEMTSDLSYRQGWPKDQSLAEALSQSWPADQERGATQVGPHRGELVIHVNGINAKDHVSRGQQKLLAAALLIAQTGLFPPDAPVRPTLLLDDPAAELDQQRLSALIEVVSGLSNQLVVTTLNEEFSAFGTPGRRWRLEQRQLTER